MKLILIVAAFLILFYCGCSMIELNIISPPGHDKMIKDCDGLKIELYIQQDTAGMSSYHGTVENGVISFSVTDYMSFDFNKKVRMKFVVIHESHNNLCSYKINSIYATDTVKLKQVLDRKNLYEVEINEFWKIQ